ncbi:NAD(P)-dependent oxidoreductase [Szabonella alba]|uniref:NAD(P)-dependent oxidoreductase n=1 Tax=Szabonella alba TaxID=2804194 RepID=A0A8K0VGF3_9RHOB|nr:NAD(P)-dependent oxidoreductase [Szabonella alba]MBL4919199.1 NAD(P)-dependent oxidoreductase [Szabonella alba]
MTELQNRTIALIGLGQMGVPMGQNLIAAGYQLRGCDLSTIARDAFEQAGGTAFVTPAAAAEGAGVVITMLPNSRIVRDALFGEGGAAARLTPGAIVIEMSSGEPAETQRIGEELAAAGIGLVDAPVSGGRKRAVDGTLTIMAGGAPDSIAAVHPVLEAMAGTIFLTGGLGSGHAMKSINNYVSGAGAAAAMEALILGRRFGLDPGVIVDILNASTGRNNTTENKLRQFILSESWASGFALGLMAKDIGIAATLAQNLELELPVLRGISQLWSEAGQSLDQSADHTELFCYLEKIAAKS